MKRLPPVLLPALLLTQIACIWDRDTLASELAGRGGAIKIIAGWFDRNPPQYYQMRLDRVTKALAANPAQLDLYDDAAVACDRLGKPDDAIAWMTRKQDHLHLEPKGAPQPNHHYRTLANLGTFRAHRWIKTRLAQPDAETDFTDLQEAESLIARAIEENPDAHFGREKYQLLAIQWLQLDSTRDSPSEHPLDLLILEPRYNTTNIRRLEELGIPDAVDGLSGMIELGAGWESIDLFTVLAAALQSEGRSQPAGMAMLRVADLRAAGRQSIHPTQNEILQAGPPGLVQDSTAYKSYYATVKAAADERHRTRSAYITTRLARGEHPDTHPAFWNDWKEPRFPAIPVSIRASDFFFGSFIGIITLAVLPFILLYIISKILQARRARST